MGTEREYYTSTIGELMRDAVDPYGWQVDELRVKFDDSEGWLGKYPVLMLILRYFAVILYMNMSIALKKEVDWEIIDAFTKTGIEEATIQCRRLAHFLDWWLNLDAEEATGGVGKWYAFDCVLRNWCKYGDMIKAGEADWQRRE